MKWIIPKLLYRMQYQKRKFKLIWKESHNRGTSGYKNDARKEYRETIKRDEWI